MSMSDSATPLGKVRGTGSAHQGGDHWLHERLVSAALLFLSLWLVASLLLLPQIDRNTLVEWLSQPSGAIPMALFVIAAFDHAIDGLKVAIDDYVHDGASRLLATGFVRFAGIGGMALALFSLAKIAFGAH
jgi:succinate dehydrogenase / fumarate reductase membrane anchor subunit